MNSSSCTSWIVIPSLDSQRTDEISAAGAGQGTGKGEGLHNSSDLAAVGILYWLRMVGTGFTLFILCMLTIVGNAMVLHAVRTDRRLQTVSNMFIVSLAIADLIVGLVVMPIGALYIFTEDWSFGLVVCQFWVGVDYTASTASILNLLILSLDRYWSVTMPLKYIRRRTKRRALFMISVVWFMSSLWLVPIIGWHHFYNDGVRIVPADVCDTEYATNTALKIVTGTLNYYLPLAIMYALYTKIFMEIRKRSKLEIGLRMCGGGGGGSAPMPPILIQTSYSDDSENRNSSLQTSMKSTKESISKKKKEMRKADYRKLAMTSSHSTSKTKYAGGSTANGETSARHQSICPQKQQQQQQQQQKQRYHRQPQLQHDDEPNLQDLLSPQTADINSDPTTSSTTTATTANTAKRDTPTIRDQRRNQFSMSVLVPPTASSSSALPTSASGTDSSGGGGGGGGGGGDSALLKRAIKWRIRAERWQQHRRPSTALAREIKAARQLGVIMGAFTVCFFPYFVCFMVVAYCDGCISPLLMTTMTWIGYLNSTMNPFLYPMCNMNFRRKFRSMMRLTSQKDIDRRGIGALMVSVQNHSVRCSALSRNSPPGFH